MHNLKEKEIGRLVSSIDYSEALQITSTSHDVLKACEMAKKYRFRAVVSFPQYLGLMVDALEDTGVLSQIPVGFPCGGVTTGVKCAEAEEGLNRGANDLDMVMNISAFQAGEFGGVAKDIKAVMAVAEPFHVPFKVIIEVGVLTDEQIVTASKLVQDCGADFIKTCTGYGPGRASVQNIGLIRETVGEQMGIKASGGVASIDDGVVLMRAGATVVAMRGHLIDQLEAIDWPCNI